MDGIRSTVFATIVEVEVADSLLGPKVLAMVRGGSSDSLAMGTQSLVTRAETLIPWAT